MTANRLVAALLAVLAAGVAAAAELRPSALEPTRVDRPVLTLEPDGDTRTLSLAEIERLPLYDTTLETNEGMAGRFTGVLLEDFLAAHDLLGADRLRFIAADGYTIYLTPADIAERSYLLATRFEGEPMSLKRKGPLRLLIPAQAEAVRDGAASAAHWIWALIEIRAR